MDKTLITVVGIAALLGVGYYLVKQNEAESQRQTAMMLAMLQNNANNGSVDTANNNGVDVYQVLDTFGKVANNLLEKF